MAERISGKFCNKKRVRYSFKFEELSFMNNAHFAAPNTEGTAIGVYRIDTGELFALFDIKEFLLLRPSTVAGGSYPLVTGILDPRTNKVYSVCVKVLLHLNSYKTHLARADLVHREDLRATRKIEVLGLPAPALFA